MAVHEMKRVAMLEAEIARLKGELLKLEHAWDHRYRLVAFGLGAIPAYFVFGALVAVVVLACTPMLIVTQTYLVGVRRVECRQLIDELTCELASQKAVSGYVE